MKESQDLWERRRGLDLTGRISGRQSSVCGKLASIFLWLSMKQFCSPRVSQRFKLTSECTPWGSRALGGAGLNTILLSPTHTNFASAICFRSWNLPHLNPPSHTQCHCPAPGVPSSSSVFLFSLLILNMFFFVFFFLLSSFFLFDSVI